MKIGVLSDTHIPQSANALPAHMLEAFKKVDMVIHAGDLVDLSVVAQLRAVCPKVTAVWGNMDPDEVRRTLHPKEIIKVAEHTIVITHGYGPPSQLQELLFRELKADKPDIIIFGHSHMPMNEMVKGILFFNPGSCTDTVFAPYCSYGIIEINGNIKGTIIKL